MNKVSSILFKIAKMDITSKEIEELISDLEEISILNDLFPCLISNKLVNIFYYQLVKYGLIQCLDKFTYKILNQIVSFSTLRNKEYEEEFRTLGYQFNSYGIKYAVIKGFHLTNSIYGYPFRFLIRDYNDIDILVNKSDLSKVNRILLNNKYIQGNLNKETLEIVPCTRQEKIDLLINTHQQYQHIKKSKYYEISHCNIQLIDVNFTIFEGGEVIDYIDIRQMLDTRVLRHTESGIEYYSLKSEYDLIQLCYHLYKDTKYEIKKKNNESLRLINFCDLYQYIRLEKENLDWGFLYQTIIDAAIENQIYYVMKLLCMIFIDLDIHDFVEKLGKKVDEKTNEEIRTGYEKILN